MKKIINFIIGILIFNNAFAQSEEADVKMDGAYFTPTTIAGCNATLSMQVSNATAGTQIPVGGFTVTVAGPVGANRAYTFKSDQPTGSGISWTFDAANNVWVGTNTVILIGGETLQYTFGVQGTNVTATPVATDVSVSVNPSWLQAANSVANDAVAPTASVSQACQTNNTITVTSNNPNPTIGDPVILTATGCPTGGTYSWNPSGGVSGGTDGSTYTVTATNSSVTYTASCSEGGSGSIAVVGQAVTPFTVTPATQSVTVGTSVTLTAAGCTGTVTWSNGATGNVLTLTAVAGATTYTATCADSRTASGTVTGTTTPISVSPATSSVTVGTSVTLTASGCAGGTVSWSNGATGLTTSVTATLGAQTITANCSLGGAASADVTGTTTPVTVTPVSSSVNVGASVTLTAAGCAGGTISWSNGATGATTSVTATLGAQTITANCSLGGSASAEVTGTTTPVSVTPATTTVTVGTSVTLTATGCAGGTISWSNGGTGATTSVVATLGLQTVTANCSLSGSASASITGTAAACAANAGTLN